MHQESKVVERSVEAKADCVTERVNPRQGSRKVTGGRGIWEKNGVFPSSRGKR